jgi:esterase/lipase
MENAFPILKFLALAFVMYCGLGLFFLLSEKSYVYHPNFPSSRDFGDCPALSSAESASYKGARFYHKHVSEKVVVMYHGNAGNACDRAIFAELFEKMGYSYLLVEYPGYGNDRAGGPSKKRILENTETIQEFLREKNYRSVTLVGESLGVGVAAYHASVGKTDKLILISPYYELADMAGWIGIVYPVRLLMRENYTPGLWLKDVKSPMLFIYAQNDEIIPRKSFEKLYNSIMAGKKRVEIKGANHNNLYSYPEFFETIKEFLR